MTLTPTLKESFIKYYKQSKTFSDLAPTEEHLWQWIEDNVIPQTKSQIAEQILGMECMQEEKLTIVGHKYGTDTGEIEKMVGDGEEEWKAPRNQLRLQIKDSILKIK